MLIQPNFPEDRRGDAAYAGVQQICDQVEASKAPGQAVYYLNADPAGREIGVTIGLEDVGFFDLQVTNGRYTRDGKRWALQTEAGLIPAPSPVQYTSHLALQHRDTVRERLGEEIFVLPVNVFADIDPDPAIDQEVAGRNVAVLYRTDNFVARLIELAKARGIYERDRPSGALVDAVMECLRSQAEAAEEAAPVAPPATTEEPPPRQVVIHAATVNVYLTGAASAVSRLELPDGG